MSENNNIEQSSAAGADEFQNTLANSRARILSYLLKLKKSIDANHSDLVQAIAQRFIEEVVDYVSYGHFRYLRQYTPETHQLAAIDKTSQTALKFSEKYTTSGPIHLQVLTQDLEHLAYTLEVRFEIEDEIANEHLVAV